MAHNYRIRSFISRLPVPAEFCLVLLIAFGFDYAYQLWTISRGDPILISNRLILSSLGLDLVKLGIILWIGRIRGWSVSTFGWRISWLGTAAGLGLFIVTVAVKILAGLAVASIPSIKPAEVAFELTLPVIILVALINPFYEELFEVGYFIHVLQRFGPWPAILASGLFRGLLHAYQGVGGMAAMFAMGLLYGIVYWRWRQLWPLVVAHILDDFLGLLYVVHH